MNSDLELGLAAREFGLFGPSRTVPYSEWVGVQLKEKCCGVTIDPAWHFCPMCAYGTKPLPCEHSPNHGGCMSLPETYTVEPVFVITEGRIEKGEGGPVIHYPVLRLECPICKKRTRNHPRTRFAVEAWNRWEFEYEGGPQ